jgi:hypothetical protein
VNNKVCFHTKVKELPAMEELQTDEATRARWIFYSALDAKATWELYHSLQVEYLVDSNVLAAGGTSSSWATSCNPKQCAWYIIALTQKAMSTGQAGRDAL